MIKTGKEHLSQLKDGRVVYIGDEKVDDVTTHPAFEKAAKKIAELYDIKHQEIYKDVLSYEENGELCSTWFLQAKNKSDLRKRSKAHKLIADQTSGMMSAIGGIGGIVGGLAGGEGGLGSLFGGGS